VSVPAHSKSHLNITRISLPLSLAESYDNENYYGALVMMMTMTNTTTPAGTTTIMTMTTTTTAIFKCC